MFSHDAMWRCEQKMAWCEFKDLLSGAQHVASDLSVKFSENKSCLLVEHR
jgi:hypothetical protein